MDDKRIVTKKGIKTKSKVKLMILDNNNFQSYKANEKKINDKINTSKFRDLKKTDNLKVCLGTNNAKDMRVKSLDQVQEHYSTRNLLRETDKQLREIDKQHSLL